MKPLWFSFSLWFILLSATAQIKNSSIGTVRRAVGPLQGGGGVIIGISHYQHLDSLQFAHRDAAAFAEFLKTQNVPDENIKLFLNQDATRFNIVDELYNLSQKLKKGDTFYFYFTGHGDLEAKIGYENSLLLLYPSLSKNYFQGNEYLQLSELRTWFGEMTKKGVQVVFIADACHSGGLIGGKEGLDKTQRALQESWQGITKILSSQTNEYSLEGKQWGGGRGIFSYFLTNGLTGRADANKDKKVSLAELSNYLKTNVVREAAPSIQTPVVQGNGKQVLSKVSEEAMKKLAQAERLNFPIMTEVNLRATDPMSMIGGLDNSLVETYKKFTKALEEKRINTFDNEKDYALLHYRKLAKEKMPEHLLAIIKRNLGAALMERELALLKPAREQGNGFVRRIEKELNPAIANLNEAMKLFGESHYLYKFLQARSLVLEAKTKFPRIPSSNKAFDTFFQEIETAYLTYYHQERRLLLQALDLEPNMISTYALLGSNYREIRNSYHPSKQSIIDQMPDSSAYYQERVVELLPNQAMAHYNLASIYQKNQILPTDKKGNYRDRTHPKAIEHFEKAAALDTNLTVAQSQLASLYMGGEIDDPFHNYPKAIEWYEKLLKKEEAKEQALLKQGIDRYLEGFKLEGNSPIRANFSVMSDYLFRLYFLHKLIGNTPKAEQYWQKLNQKSDKIATPGVYMTNAMHIVFMYSWSEDEDLLWKALAFEEKGLKRATETMNEVAEKDKPLASLRYQYYLKAVGAAHRAVKNYDKAESYLQQAIAHPVLKGSFTGRLMGSYSTGNANEDRDITIPIPLQIYQDGSVHYRIDANWEMFWLKYEQGKIEEAFEWLEKGFQVAVTENGNDLSGDPYERYFIRSFPSLKDRFLTLKAKYFPPTEKK